MKFITIKGSKRESVGKVATKALRNAEKVPCVLYGREHTIHFSADEKAFKNLVYTPNVYTAKIELEGEKSYNAILQDIQFHPVTDKILHVDFYQLLDDKEITMEIPVRIVGTSPGVLNGGSLRFNLRKLSLRALPKNLPDFINADISNLEIGGKLYVTQLANKNYTLLHPDNTVVVQVRIARGAVVAAENVEGAADTNKADEAPAEE